MRAPFTAGLTSPNTMYAVIATGGKQYRVTKDEVLLVGAGADVKVGRPTLQGGKVLATVVRHGRSAKVSVVKFKRRAHYLRQKNHRQLFTEVKVTDISAGQL